MGEQAGVLRLELLAVLQGQERGSGVTGRGRKDKLSVIGAKDRSQGSQLRRRGLGLEKGPAAMAHLWTHTMSAAGQGGGSEGLT